jgi:hypothetical protein
MIRILWLLIVGSWRFPWEKEPQKLPGIRKYDWRAAQRNECGYIYQPENAGNLYHCNGDPSEWCSDGRCRVHCRESCKCETTRPDAPAPLLEAPRDPTPPISTGAYR